MTTGLVERLRADLRRTTTVDMWLPRAELVNLPPLLAELTAVPRGREGERSGTSATPATAPCHDPADQTASRYAGTPSNSSTVTKR